jgi:hypothetical protein
MLINREKKKSGTKTALAKAEKCLIDEQSTLAGFSLPRMCPEG